MSGQVESMEDGRSEVVDGETSYQAICTQARANVSGATMRYGRGGGLGGLRRLGELAPG